MATATALSWQEALSSSGCCSRCILRIEGVHHAGRYTASDGVETAGVGVCPLCLGLLQGCINAESIAQLAQQVKQSGYDLRSFCVAVVVPPILLLRQRAAFLHLSSAAATAPVSLANPERVVDLKECVRWLVSEQLQAELGVGYDTLSPLQLQLCVVLPGDSAAERAVLDQLVPPPRQQTKRRQRSGAWQTFAPPAPAEAEPHSIRAIVSALAEPQANELIAASPALFPPKPQEESCRLTLALEHAHHYITGMYCKLSRELPQTAWIIEGARKCESSVQEIIEAPALGIFGASSARFHSAGREDVDVRMLGDGRPFVLELKAPGKPYQSEEAYRRLEEEANRGGLVRIHSLRKGSADLVGGLIKQGEDAHSKDYRCIVRLSRDVTAADLAAFEAAAPVQLKQLTPLRVLHRRTLMVRDRAVYRISAVRLASRFLQLDLSTQAGTYVKEFVHGDFGRTTPNVGSLLGCAADILQLDVLGLHEGGEGAAQGTVEAPEERGGEEDGEEDGGHGENGGDGAGERVDD